MCPQLRTAHLSSEVYTDSVRYAWLQQEPSRGLEHLTVANRTGHQRGHSDPSNAMSSRREFDEGYESSRRRHQKLTDQLHADSSDILRDMKTIKTVLGKETSNSTTDSIARDIDQNERSQELTRSITRTGDLSPSLSSSKVTSLEQLQPSSSPRVTDLAQADSGDGHAVSAELNTVAQFPESSNTPKLPAKIESKISSDSKSNNAFASEWNYIQGRRNNHMGLQSQTRVLRTTLREKHSVKSALEDKLFQRVKRKELGFSSNEDNAKMESEPILELMQIYQAARDDYGPMQDDYDQLEDQLYADSYQLNRLETDFFARWTVTSESTVGRASTAKSEDSMSDATGDGDEDEDLTYHPLVARYLSKLGDLDIAQERLDELLDETEQLEEQKTTRAKFGLKLGVEEQSWLDESQGLQNEIEDQITVLADEVEKLKQQSIAQGLLDEDGQPIDLKAHVQEKFGQEDGLDPGPHVSEYTKHPILLHQPGATSDSGSDYLPDLGEEYYTVRGRINFWLLDRLRNSALDVSLLAWTYEKEGGQTSNGWQKSVLENWYDDGTLWPLADLKAHTFSLYHSAKSSRDENSRNIVHPSSKLDSDQSEYGTEKTLQFPSPPGHLSGQIGGING